MRHEIRAIIFDMGGVTIRPNERHIISHVAKILCVDKNRLEKTVLNSRFEDSIVTGKVNVDGFWKNICENLGVAYDKKTAAVWINEYRAPVNAAVINLIMKLRKKYAVASITDVSKTRVAYHRKRSLYKPFRFVVFSCYAHVRKPHKKIYKIALKRLRLKPQECLFIDDKERNVKGARKVGMAAIQFRNVGKLKRGLKKLGVSWTSGSMDSM